MTEQYVCQQLTGAVDFIYYWSADNSRGEIDFLIQTGGRIVPIEVKAEENLRARSLKAFCEKYNLKLTIAYSKTDVYNEGKIIYQSRAAKSEIVKGASLKITIAKPLDSSDNPDDEGKPAEEEQNP